MEILIKNGLVIDPANKINEVCDVLVSGARISAVKKNIKKNADRIIDAKDKIVMPGIVDMHVHLREPGREDKETVATGTNAAAKGGVTSVLAMPNTFPAMDSSANIKLLRNIIKKTGKVEVFLAGSITKGLLGEELCNIAELKRAGAIAISDDGYSVDSDDIMLKAFDRAKKEKMIVICHCEDKSLSRSGAVNLGLTSTRLGLRGISKESEYKRVERDIKLAEKSSANVHIAHVSCRESVEAIEKAKKKGVSVTAETAPHYFTLSEEDLLDYNTNMKINPPLRAIDDVVSIKEALRNGIIDVIASDHAPHTENEKDIEFEYAASGTIGLETELALAVTELVDNGILNWEDLIRKMCVNPCAILGIDKGSLGIGCDADIAIVSPKTQWSIKKDDFVSRSKNSAFLGKKLKGKIDYTISKGNIVYEIHS